MNGSTIKNVQRQYNKMYFKIEKIEPNFAYDSILKTFNEDLQDHFKNNLSLKLKDMIEKNQEVFKGFLYEPKDSEVTKQVIGRKGHYFYKTTELCNILYIWHNIEEKKFIFWSDNRQNIIQALNQIKYRIEKHSNPGWN